MGCNVHGGPSHGVCFWPSKCLPSAYKPVAPQGRRRETSQNWGWSTRPCVLLLRGVPLQACRQGCEGSGQADTLSVAVPAPQPRSSYGRGHLANRARNTPYLLAPGQRLPCRDKHHPGDSTEGLSLSLWRSGWAEPHPVTGAPRLEQLGVSAANGSFLLSKTAFSPQRRHL